MPSILHAAKYITSRIAPIETTKLHKLCYYFQAWALAWDGKPIFDEDFEAWAGGPVCPQLMAAHQGEFVVDASFPQSVEKTYFTQDEAETMEAVLRDYGDKSPRWLSELVHMEIPWMDARKGTAPGARCNKIIPKEAMQDYYAGLIEEE